MALTNKLKNIGDAIREKTGKTDLLTLDQMAEEITAIETGGGGFEIPVVTGDCRYRFSYDGWNEVMSEITTQDITNCQYMFRNSKNLTNIPFEINCKANTEIDLSNIFEGCNSLTSIPKFNNCKIKTMAQMFYLCYDLRNLPDDIGSWFDWSVMESKTSTSYSKKEMFGSCYSLRSIPMDFLSQDSAGRPYSVSVYYRGFNNCYSLDEIVGLPVPYTGVVWSANSFSDTFTNCGRLKNITFATQEDGSPYVVKWKSQTIDLSKYVGYISSSMNITSQNNGITSATVINNATQYQERKDNPDSFTGSLEFCRYNHDSAVATINSLPDASAYLATTTGTNTIKFKGASGSATDGGAINTLTEEEIAVATAKGWTVSLV